MHRLLPQSGASLEGGGCFGLGMFNALLVLNLRNSVYFTLHFPFALVSFFCFLFCSAPLNAFLNVFPQRSGVHFFFIWWSSSSYSLFPGLIGKSCSLIHPLPPPPPHPQKNPQQNKTKNKNSNVNNSMPSSLFSTYLFSSSSSSNYINNKRSPSLIRRRKHVVENVIQATNNGGESDIHMSKPNLLPQSLRLHTVHAVSKTVQSIHTASDGA